MTFACKITDRDYLAAFAPEQPDEIVVGQNWMRASDGVELPIKRVRETFVDLGSDSYTVVLSADALREEWVCTDLSPLPPVASIQDGEPK